MHPRLMQKNIAKWGEGMQKAPPEMKQASRIMELVQGIEEASDGKTYGQILAEIATGKGEKGSTNDQKIRSIKLIMDAFQAADLKDEKLNLENMDHADLQARMYEAAEKTFLEGDIQSEGLFLSLAYAVFQAKPHLWQQMQSDPPANCVIEVKVLEDHEP